MEGLPIPVSAASDIGRAFKKSAVIVVGWDPATGHTHVATWGEGAEERDIAAKAGERVAALLTGSEVRKMFEDFRGSGAALIAAERDRQKSQEGWTSDHDDEHDCGKPLYGAVAYALASSDQTRDRQDAFEFWPFEAASFKPSDEPIRNLVKAGALIAAEIDRLLRTARTAKGASGAHGDAAREADC